MRERGMIRRRRISEQHQAGDTAKRYRADLIQGGRQREDDRGGRDGDAGALAIRRQRSHHSEHGLRHDSHGRDLEAVQPTAAEHVADRGRAEAEQDERKGRQQGEAGPCSERTRISRARQTDGDSDLAACRARQELRQRHKICVGLFFKPLASDDELVAEVTEMRNRSAEARQSEPSEGHEDFEGRARLMLDRHFRPSRYLRAVIWPRYGSIRCPVAALMAASTRVAAPSLVRALSMWKSTVRLDRPRICAISADVLPRAAQVSVSTSRSLRSTSLGHSSLRATPARRATMIVSSRSKSMGLVT